MDTERDREECDDLAGELAGQVLELVQGRIIAEHKAGRLSAPNGVYVGTSTMARVAAVLIAGQLPLSQVSRLQQIVSSFNKMFSSECDTIITTRQFEERGHGDSTVKKASAWDA